MRTGIHSCILGAVLATALAAAAQISDVVARAVSPWRGRVLVSYVLDEPIAPARGCSLVQTVTVRAARGSAALVLTNDAAEATLFPRTPSFAAGAHRFLWTPTAQMRTLFNGPVSVEIAIRQVALPETYCVVDLSAGASAANYPVSYRADVPSGGWTGADKTERLVLRLIQPGLFTMGAGAHGTPLSPDVKISQPYYIAVFETTQRQWELVTGSTPSAFAGPSRPVESILYTDIRGGDQGAQWPSVAAVDAASPLQALRARTGLLFDLPTEAQWEYACRAGTSTDYGNGSDYTSSGQDSAMAAVGCYLYNGSNSTASVGQFAPNAWGLYDMHGNVQELCLDVYDDWPDSFWTVVGGYVVDPPGPYWYGYGAEHVAKGGHLNNSARYCTSAARDRVADDHAGGDTGFRLVCPVPAARNELLSAAVSDAVAVDFGSGDLPVGSDPVPVDLDPLLAEVGEAAAWTVRLVVDDGVALETNAVATVAFMPSWPSNVLRHIVFENGVPRGEILQTLAVTNGPDTYSLGECVNCPGWTFSSGGTGLWINDTATNHDGVVSLRSQGTGDDGESWLETTVTGPGELSFWWRVSSEVFKKYVLDYLRFSVDGEIVADEFGGEQDWTRVTVAVTGEGPHVLRWSYVKDEEDAQGDDCGWIDEVSWTGAPPVGGDATRTTPVPVPHVWLEQYPSILAAADGDYERAANATNKTGASGLPWRVWEDFVAGTDPMDPSDVFTADIALSNGVPFVTWRPDLNTNGVVRVYRILGKADLRDAGDWQYPTNSSHRFFKVGVDMP